MTLRKAAAATFSIFVICLGAPAFARGGGAAGGHGVSGHGLSGHGFGHSGAQGYGRGRGFAASTLVGRASRFSARAGQVFTGRPSGGRSFVARSREAWAGGYAGQGGGLVGGDGPSPVVDSYAAACGHAYDEPGRGREPIVIYGIAPDCGSDAWGSGPGVYYMK